MTNPKWILSPEAALREISEEDVDPRHLETICGVHYIIFATFNRIENLDPDVRSEINSLLERAYSMGKRMDYRLRVYRKQEAGEEAAIRASAEGEFSTRTIPKDEWNGALAPPKVTGPKIRKRGRKPKT